MQDGASYSRLVTCSQASGGKRVGTAGKKIGQAPRTWAFSEAAVLVRRHTPQGQKLLTRLEKKHDTGTALTRLAHTLARAVYDLLQRQTAFAMARFLRASGSRAGEPGVSLDTQREEPASSGLSVLLHGVFARQGVRRGPFPGALRFAWTPALASPYTVMAAYGWRVLPLPRA